MNKKTLRIAGWALGLSMAVAGIGVAVGANAFLCEPNHSIGVYASDGTEHAIDSFTGKDGSGTLLNNGGTPSEIVINNLDYSIKQIKIGWSHNKTNDGVTASVTVGGTPLGNGKVGGQNGAFTTTIGDGETSLSGDVRISFTNGMTGTGKGTLYLKSLTLIEGVSSSKTSTVLSLSSEEDKDTINYGDTLQLTSVVKDNKSNVIGGAIVTYSSSDDSIASVDQNGLVTASLSKRGSVRITAVYSGDEDYAGSAAYFDLRVVDPYLSEFVISSIASANSWANDTAYSNLGTVGNVTITASGTGNNKKYYTSDDTWRFYSSGNGALTVTAASGYYLKKVTFVGTNYFNSAPDNWTYSSNVFIASNKAQTSVTFGHGSGSSKISQIDVEVGVSYAVSYHANGGTGTISDPNSPYDSGSLVTVKPNTFTAPLGYVFDRWNTSADGNGTDYDPADTFTITSNTTLYAQWVPAGDDPYVALTLTSSSTPFKGATISITAASGNLEGTGNLSWTVESGSVTNEVKSNSAYTATLASTGTITIRATDEGGTAYDEVSVNVSAVTVNLDMDSISLYGGDSRTLTASVNTGSVNWSSNNPSVTVSADPENPLKGIVTVAQNATVGSEATITATSTIDNSVQSACTVSIIAFNGYTKVTDANELVIGDSYILGVDNSTYSTSIMAGVSGNSNYRECVDEDSIFNNDKTQVTNNLPSGAVVVTLLSDGNGKYYFYDITNDAYLKGNTSENYLQNVDSLSDATAWSIGFSSGHLEITLSGSTRVLGFNVGSPRFSTYASYATYNYTMKNGTAHPILFHLDGSSVKTAADSFAVNSLKIGDPKYDGLEINDENDPATACATNYENMKLAYVGLSDAVKNVFEYSSDFGAARARMNKWAKANSEEFTYGAKTPFAAAVSNYGWESVTSHDSSLPLLITVTAIGVATAGGYFFVSHRRREE